MRVDDLRGLPIFEGLTDDQLAELVAGGTEVLVEPGVDLFSEGEPADFWWVLVDAAIDLVRRIGREDTVVARMDVPGRWAGGFRAWDGHGVYLATGRGVTAGRVLRVPGRGAPRPVQRLVPVRRPPDSGALPHRALDQVHSPPARVPGHPGDARCRPRHELNNPAAAAVRAVDALDAACAALRSSLGRLARDELSPEQLSAVDALRGELEHEAADLDPLDRADREQALASWLTRHGVARPWTIAPPLADAGADPAWCERAATVLEGPALEAGLEWVASTLSVATLLGEVRESTRRISELVGAVRSYSQLDRASVQQVDVADGLESTLVMLGHKLGDGVAVMRDYGAGVPRIEAYPGELNQVWTNLIDNALDAMAGAGTLRVSTRAESDGVVVEIGDTGPGMPPQVAARAFDAFYTTKDVGRGTGLRLDIARRIVEDRHGGTIAIDSRPGATVLRVRLPVRRPR
jgi:signal transduction histidine kinase